MLRITFLSISIDKKCYLQFALCDVNWADTVCFSDSGCFYVIGFHSWMHDYVGCFSVVIILFNIYFDVQIMGRIRFGEGVWAPLSLIRKLGLFYVL